MYKMKLGFNVVLGFIDLNCMDNILENLFFCYTGLERHEVE